MTSVNIDVIAIVIDNIKDDRGTLFSLLTVNKQVFRYTCRILYRDPLRFIRRLNINRTSSMRALSLIRLLLRISPATDDDTNLFRRVFDVPVKHESAVEHQPRPMFDYLSFIQNARLEQALRLLAMKSICSWETEQVCERASTRGFHTPASFLRHILTWSIFGHRLGDLHELEIEPGAIPCFVDEVSNLCRLRYMIIATQDSSFHQLVNTVYPAALRLVKAFRQHHDWKQLIDCRFTHESSYSQDVAIFKWSVQLYELLPPLVPRGLNLVRPIRPMDGYLTRITVLERLRRPNERWAEFTKEYSDMSAGQILQRCRSLVKLFLDISKGANGDLSVLEWAVEEARKRAAKELLAPAVPLNELHLSMKGYRSAATCRVLADVFQGFSQSLRSIVATFELHEGEVVDPSSLPILEDAPRVVMARLDSFQISGPDPAMLDGRLLQFLPRLTCLQINLGKYIAFDVPLPSWPVFDMPSLTLLHLAGHVVHLFDPASFHHMPRLRDIKLSDVWAGSRYSRNRPCPLDRWTWDWSMPELTNLRLIMSSWTTMFDFKALRGCPKLQRLYIEFPRYTHETLYRIKVAPSLPNHTQDVFPELRYLGLIGRCRLQPEDLEALLGRILPGLKEFILNNLSQCTLRQVVNVTRHHTSLKAVWLQYGPVEDDECQKLGLVERGMDDSVGTDCVYTLRQLSWSKKYTLQKSQ
ncbi:hypothetical protein DFQ27_006114 [Actinomortierella ambigua]|uniref:F-box domain-containing protein n=1 Tax=Actinomortierella ambigua TaxID=1343610 RepID=A0A9P6PWT8_9FUNG|nr:hypothetical protein DFQ27_006114 [Actinomortierella ambigua]